MSKGKFGVKEVMDITLYDMVTGDPVIVFDTLKTSNVEFTSEKVHARGGKGNPKLLTWDISKEAVLKIEDALISKKSLELVSGLASKTGAVQAYMRQTHEYDTTGKYPKDKGDLYPLTATGAGIINLAYEPDVDLTKIKVYEASDDCGEKMDMTGATLEGKVLTIPAAKNKQVIVYYTYQTPDTATTYVIDSAHFASTYKMVGDTVIRDLETKQDEPFQMIVENLKFDSNLTLNFSAEGDPEPTSFECEILKDANTSQMVRFIQYPTN